MGVEWLERWLLTGNAGGTIPAMAVIAVIGWWWGGLER
jgi:hypothetical protein